MKFYIPRLVTDVNNSSLILVNKHGQGTFRKITHIKHIKIIAVNIVTNKRKSQFNSFTRNILCSIAASRRKLDENGSLQCVIITQRVVVIPYRRLGTLSLPDA